jgi:hypothetical protein
VKCDTKHNDPQHIDTQYNETQHIDTQHNETQHNDTQHNDSQHNGRMLLCRVSLILSVENKPLMLSAECRGAILKY